MPMVSSAVVVSPHVIATHSRRRVRSPLRPRRADASVALALAQIWARCAIQSSPERDSQTSARVGPSPVR
jgi:hypothetical protein